ISDSRRRRWTSPSSRYRLVFFTHVGYHVGHTSPRLLPPFINFPVDKSVQSSAMDRKQDVLALLKARGSVGLADIAEHLGVSKQGALRHLEALQARGLVEVSV